jgi:GDP-4-dehydro-6-deoxy-D-mannose reductase
MRILITGVTGFIGGHLVELLNREGGHTLAGISRLANGTPSPRSLANTVDLHVAELRDTEQLESILRKHQPEAIVHLAGYANAGRSFVEVEKCWEDNVNGTRSLYNAVHRSGLRPRIVFVSTGLVYGDPESPNHFCDESSVLKPSSPYAASKAAADLMSYQYCRNPGLDIVRVRLFNQIGPRQTPDYAIANFARQIAAIEAGKQSHIETGDLSAHRDLTDVRDIVRAFHLLIDRGVSGEVYNAGRGQTWQIQEVLDRLIAISGHTVEVRQKIDPNRKADTAITRVSVQKLMSTTGWQPQFTLDETVLDTLNYWRSLTSQTAA